MMCGFSKRQFFKNVNIYHYIKLCNLFSWIGNSFSKFAIGILQNDACKSRVRIEIQMNCVPVNQENEIIPNPREWISQFDNKIYFCISLSETGRGWKFWLTPLEEASVKIFSLSQGVSQNFQPLPRCQSKFSASPKASVKIFSLDESHQDQFCMCVSTWWHKVELCKFRMERIWVV